MLGFTYHHLYGQSITGLRFFTVYGPWGRPDQAPMLFTKAILAGQPIKVFNEGRMQRDFTYIDDIVEGVVRVLALPPAPGSGGARAAVFNIGNQEAVLLTAFIAALARVLGREPVCDLQPMQPGDVPATYASIENLRAATGFAPRTPLAASRARSRFSQSP
jgi:UDP-glucuronate 4-epimerase